MTALVNDQLLNTEFRKVKFWVHYFLTLIWLIFCINMKTVKLKIILVLLLMFSYKLCSIVVDLNYLLSYRVFTWDPKWNIPGMKFHFAMKKNLFTLLDIAGEMKRNFISGLVVLKRPIKKYKQKTSGDFWIWLIERAWTVYLFCQFCQALSQLHPHYWLSFRIFHYPYSSIKQKIRNISWLPWL